MRWREKLIYWLMPKVHPYTKVMDDLINDFIRCGNFLGITTEGSLLNCNYLFTVTYAIIEMDKDIYSVDLDRYGTSDITKVSYVSRIKPHNMTSYLYRMRPSRRTQICFWEWLESQVPIYFVNSDAIIPGTSYAKNISERIQATICPEQEG